MLFRSGAINIAKTSATIVKYRLFTSVFMDFAIRFIVVLVMFRFVHILEFSPQGMNDHPQADPHCRALPLRCAVT